MRIAICIHGNLGSKKRGFERGNQLNKDELLIENNSNLYDPILGYNNLKNLIDKYDTDVFCHCWNLDAKDKVVNLYKPKKYLFEEPKSFDVSLKDYNINTNEKDINKWNINNIAKKGYKHYSYVRNHDFDKIIKELGCLSFRSSSRLYSLQYSINLMNEYKNEQKINYDWILICRFDNHWNFPRFKLTKTTNNKINYGENDVSQINLNLLNKEYIYGENDKDPSVRDLYLLISDTNIKYFYNIYNERFNYCMRVPVYFNEIIQKTKHKKLITL